MRGNGIYIMKYLPFLGLMNDDNVAGSLACETINDEGGAVLIVERERLRAWRLN
jgi:hypothetical protein